MDESHRLSTKLLHVAWMAIALGLTLQFTTSIVAGLVGGAFPDAATWVRDATQKISWSTFTCLGVALGTAASKARAMWTGLAGLFAAPAAFITARTVQKGVGAAVGANVAAMSAVAFWSVLALKSGQYATFGALLAYAASRPWGGLWTHIGVGAASGLVFGLSALAIVTSSAAKPPPMGAVVGQAVNEVLFPVGCALVLYFASKMSSVVKKVEG
ncbi:MAG: hypothetical protein ACKVS9_10620 [Phycisphaerae bacterium]